MSDLSQSKNGGSPPAEQDRPKDLLVPPTSPAKSSSSPSGSPRKDSPINPQQTWLNYEKRSPRSSPKLKSDGKSSKEGFPAPNEGKTAGAEEQGKEVETNPAFSPPVTRSKGKVVAGVDQAKELMESLRRLSTESLEDQSTATTGQKSEKADDEKMTEKAACDAVVPKVGLGKSPSREVMYSVKLPSNKTFNFTKTKLFCILGEGTKDIEKGKMLRECAAILFQGCEIEYSPSQETKDEKLLGEFVLFMYNLGDAFKSQMVPTCHSEKEKGQKKPPNK